MKRKLLSIFFLLFLASFTFAVIDRTSCWLTGDYAVVQDPDGSVYCRYDQICYYEDGERMEGVVLTDCSEIVFWTIAHLP